MTDAEFKMKRVVRTAQLFSFLLTDTSYQDILSEIHTRIDCTEGVSPARFAAQVRQIILHGEFQ